MGGENNVAIVADEPSEVVKIYRTPEEAEALLAEGLSSSAVRENARGMSYVDGHYVVSRLNRVFGPFGWSLDLVALECTTDGFYPDPNPQKAEKGQIRIGHMARVRLNVRVAPGGSRWETIDVCREDVGHGSGIGKDRAEAVESSVKEAVTDALKRAARHLGPSMGLALYDKDQRDVRDAETPEEIRELLAQGRIAEARSAIQGMPKDHPERSALIAEYEEAKRG